jgi:3'-phosphoadenosine 5'-phosphosulfate sulfotransferase (PAPS reductase)/FAD synthetase
MSHPASLTRYDVIVVNSSGGKDSQAMLDLLVEQADASGVRDRLVVVHCDLGRVEWTGTRELAERQAAHYGLRFEVVSRPQGDLLTHVEQRRMWPSSTARYCTSDHKRGQVRRVLTKLTDEVRARTGRQARILNCMGLRAQESPARAKKIAFEFDAKASNGRRHVDTWLPILDWSTEQVWARIKASGVEHHRAYDLGMGRLSCVFCIFAPKSALLIAGKHNRALLDSYVEVETKIGHDFRKGFKLRVIRDEVEAGIDTSKLAAEDSGCWNM